MGAVQHTENFLRQLATIEASAVGTALAISASPGGGEDFGAVLSPRVRMLVHLAALLTLKAGTTSLRWAVERATCAGADEDQIVGVLLAIAPEVGGPCTVAGARRLLFALGFELDEPPQID